MPVIALSEYAARAFHRAAAPVPPRTITFPGVGTKVSPGWKRPPCAVKAKQSEPSPLALKRVTTVPMLVPVAPSVNLAPYEPPRAISVNGIPVASASSARSDTWPLSVAENAPWPSIPAVVGPCCRPDWFARTGTSPTARCSPPRGGQADSKQKRRSGLCPDNPSRKRPLPGPLLVARTRTPTNGRRFVPTLERP